MKMIDVGAKEKTARTAVATAQVRMLPATIRRIREGKVEKGDVIAAARLAGVMAAKRTPDLIPLCHPISLSAVSVELALSKEGVEIRSEVKTVDRTGVESRWVQLRIPFSSGARNSRSSSGRPPI